MITFVLCICVWQFDNRDVVIVERACNKADFRRLVQIDYADAISSPYRDLQRPVHRINQMSSSRLCFGTQTAIAGNSPPFGEPYNIDSKFATRFSVLYDRQRDSRPRARGLLSAPARSSTTPRRNPSAFHRRESMSSAPLPFNELRSGLAILLQARDWASSSEIAQWEFAVPIVRLREAGLSETHLRWLVLGNHVEHAFELSLAGDEKRSFRQLKTLNFRRRSCFILSQDGAEFARLLCARGNDVEAHNDSPGNRAQPAVSLPEIPHWDAPLRQLMFGEKVVKRLQRPAKSQEVILTSFEEEHWPRRIDDPLPRVAGRDPKRRLRGVIESLNQNHVAPLIHFFGDGTGETVCWTAVPS